MFFSVFTLGCKLNQLETEAIADALIREGFCFVPWDSPDFRSKRLSAIVINTCTVTSKSEQKARRVIRKALRDPGKPFVIVSVCYAQLEGSAIRALETQSDCIFKRLFVIPGSQKDRLLELPRFLAAAAKSCAAEPGTAELAALVT